MQKTETSTHVSSAPRPPAAESPKVPHVELRPVGLAKPNRPVSAPPSQLLIPPPPPSNAPPDTPPPPTTPPPPVITTVNATTQKEKGL